MNKTENIFLDSLKTGFIEQSIISDKELRPDILTNDTETGKKVLADLDWELSKCDEFWFSVAFVTTSGVAAIINRLIDLEERNIQGKILVSDYLAFTQPEALKKLISFKNIKLKIARKNSFHAKGYFFRKQDYSCLIIGSSNLTSDALCSNIEWNIKLTLNESGELYEKVTREFSKNFSLSDEVDLKLIEEYEKVYQAQQQISNNQVFQNRLISAKNIQPNFMQKNALESLDLLRKEGKNKAILISATGTGKTYLSAFDVRDFKPKTLLFVVHRQLIAKAAMRTFGSLLAENVTLGMFSGDKKEVNADFIFSTVQTMSKPENLAMFKEDHFEYIVIDETHRAGADSYLRILDYFKPKFLLGMTATPERMDGIDVFRLFEYNIAYEIRLHQAMKERMLSDFHYYGVTDLSIDGKIIDDKSEFNLLINSERVDRIIEKSRLYGTDTGQIRGLIFCSRVDEARNLATELNKRGFKTVALAGENTEDERNKAIQKLESNHEDKLDYIITVDIFNEGIDIPSVNQIILMRPTQSAIIFVQQLGRGLRRAIGKEYLTVIDFIGNYSNNYLVPVALFGDTSYKKDTLRSLLASGSQLIPGSSTVNFEKITKDRIYASIDSANLKNRKDLVNDYKLLKYKLGRIPMMIDFIEHGSRDPYLFAESKNSYYLFVKSVEEQFDDSLSIKQLDYLRYFTSDINNGKRIGETILLLVLMNKLVITKEDYKKIFFKKIGVEITDEEVESVINNLDFRFVNKQSGSNLVALNEACNFDVITHDESTIRLTQTFITELKNEQFKVYLIDTIWCAIKVFETDFALEKYFNGFLLYKKYSRKDVFRILNWKSNPMAQNVGGYMISSDRSNCPIFVNYHKHENITNTTKYEDVFLNNQEFQYMSKSKRTMESPDVRTLRTFTDGYHIPLFIKKSNDEGLDFYFMGFVYALPELFKETVMEDDNGGTVSVVKMVFKLYNPVEKYIFNYLTEL